MRALRFACLLSTCLLASAPVLAQDNEVRPGNWYPGYENNPVEYQPAFSDGSITEEDRRDGEAYGRLVVSLAEAGCPRAYPYSGVDPRGEAYREGDPVDIRLREHCRSRQLRFIADESGMALDALYSLLNGIGPGDGPFAGYLGDKLVADHSAWLGRMDSECSYEAAWYFGGTGETITWLDCAVVAFENRLVWIESQIMRGNDHLGSEPDR